MGGHRILRVTTELLASIFGTGDYPARRVTGGLPPDAEFDGAMYDPVGRVMVLRFRSAAWEPTPEGHRLPELNLSVSTYYDDASLPPDWRAAEKAAAAKAADEWVARRVSLTGGSAVSYEAISSVPREADFGADPVSVVEGSP